VWEVGAGATVPSLEPAAAWFAANGGSLDFEARVARLCLESLLSADAAGDAEETLEWIARALVPRLRASSAASSAAQLDRIGVRAAALATSPAEPPLPARARALSEEVRRRGASAASG